MTLARAAIAYFAIAFAAGFIAGTIRTLIITPRLGESLAVAIELPVMVAVSWWACGWVLKRWPVDKGLSSRLTMGLLALALLLLAEVGVSVALGGLTLPQHLALYATLPVQLGLMGQLLFAAFPLIRRRCR